MAFRTTSVGCVGSTGAQAVPQQVCTACGNIFLPEARYCRHCGEPRRLEGAVSSTSPPRPAQLQTPTSYQQAPSSPTSPTSPNSLSQSFPQWRPQPCQLPSPLGAFGSAPASVAATPTVASAVALASGVAARAPTLGVTLGVGTGYGCAAPSLEQWQRRGLIATASSITSNSHIPSSFVSSPGHSLPSSPVATTIRLDETVQTFSSPATTATTIKLEETDIRGPRARHSMRRVVLLDAAFQYGRVVLLCLSIRTWALATARAREATMEEQYAAAELAASRKALFRWARHAGAVEFLLTMIEMHEIDQLLHLSLLWWRLSIIDYATTRQELFIVKVALLRLARYANSVEYLLALLSEQREDGLLQLCFYQWCQVVAQAAVTLAQTSEKEAARAAAVTLDCARRESSARESAIVQLTAQRYTNRLKAVELLFNILKHETKQHRLIRAFDLWRLSCMQRRGATLWISARVVKGLDLGHEQTMFTLWQRLATMGRQHKAEVENMGRLHRDDVCGLLELHASSEDEQSLCLCLMKWVHLALGRRHKQKLKKLIQPAQLSEYDPLVSICWLMWGEFVIGQRHEQELTKAKGARSLAVDAHEVLLDRTQTALFLWSPNVLLKGILGAWSLATRYIILWHFRVQALKDVVTRLYNDCNAQVALLFWMGWVELLCERKRFHQASRRMDEQQRRMDEQQQLHWTALCRCTRNTVERWVNRFDAGFNHFVFRVWFEAWRNTHAECGVLTNCCNRAHSDMLGAYIFMCWASWREFVLCQRRENQEQLIARRLESHQDLLNTTRARFCDVLNRENDVETQQMMLAMIYQLWRRWILHTTDTEGLLELHAAAKDRHWLMVCWFRWVRQFGDEVHRGRVDGMKRKDVTCWEHTWALEERYWNEGLLGTSFQQWRHWWETHNAKGKQRFVVEQLFGRRSDTANLDLMHAVWDSWGREFLDCCKLRRLRRETCRQSLGGILNRASADLDTAFFRSILERWQYCATVLAAARQCEILHAELKVSQAKREQLAFGAERQLEHHQREDLLRICTSSWLLVSQRAKQELLGERAVAEAATLNARRVAEAATLNARRVAEAATLNARRSTLADAADQQISLQRQEHGVSIALRGWLYVAKAASRARNAARIRGRMSVCVEITSMLHLCIAAWLIATQQDARSALDRALVRIDGTVEVTIGLWEYSNHAMLASTYFSSWRLNVAAQQLASWLKRSEHLRALSVNDRDRMVRALGAERLCYLHDHIRSVALSAWSSISGRKIVGRRQRARAADRLSSEHFLASTGICLLAWRQMVSINRAEKIKHQHSVIADTKLLLWESDQMTSFLKVIWERWRESVAAERELDLRALCVAQVERARLLHDVGSERILRRGESIVEIATLRYVLVWWACRARALKKASITLKRFFLLERCFTIAACFGIWRFKVREIRFATCGGDWRIRDVAELLVLFSFRLWQTSISKDKYRAMHQGLMCMADRDAIMHVTFQTWRTRYRKTKSTVVATIVSTRQTLGLWFDRWWASVVRSIDSQAHRAAGMNWFANRDGLSMLVHIITAWYICAGKGKVSNLQGKASNLQERFHIALNAADTLAVRVERLSSWYVVAQAFRREVDLKVKRQAVNAAISITSTCSLHQLVLYCVLSWQNQCGMSAALSELALMDRKNKSLIRCYRVAAGQLFLELRLSALSSAWLLWRRVFNRRKLVAAVKLALPNDNRGLLQAICKSWLAQATRERTTNQETMLRHHKFKVQCHLAEGHRQEHDRMLISAVFTNWSRIVASEACVIFARHVRRQTGIIMSNISERWMMQHHVWQLAYVWFVWRDCLKVTYNCSRFSRLRELCIYQTEREALASIRIYFTGWLFALSHRAVQMAMRTNAELSYWAQLHLLARLVLGRWVSLAALSRELKLKLDHIGQQRMRGVRSLINRLAHCLDFEAITRRCLIDWSRTAVRRRMVSSDTLQRGILTSLINSMALRMQNSSFALFTNHVWYSWVLSCRLSAAESTAAVNSNARCLKDKYRSVLIGTMLLVWAQEQMLAFAQAALVEWSRVAVFTAHGASVVVLEERLAALAGACADDRSRYRSKVRALAGRSFDHSEVDGLLLCLVAWRQRVTELRVERSQQRLALQHAYSVEMKTSLVRRGINLSSHNALMHSSLLTLVGALVAWRRCSTIQFRVVRSHHGGADSALLRACTSAHSIVVTVLQGLKFRDAQFILVAWWSATLTARCGEALVSMRSNNRNHAFRVSGRLINRSFHRELGLWGAVSYWAWRSEVLHIQHAYASYRLDHLYRRGGIPCFATPWWCLLCWQATTLAEGRCKLRQDASMMLALLQQTSITIEELRVRLLSMRIYGLVRRKILECWYQAVFAPPVEGAWRAKDVMRVVRSVSSVGDATPNSVTGAPVTGSRMLRRTVAPAALNGGLSPAMPAHERIAAFAATLPTAEALPAPPAQTQMNPQLQHWAADDPVAMLAPRMPQLQHHAASDDSEGQLAPRLPQSALLHAQ